jgi:HAMP domain-containing protein
VAEQSVRQAASSFNALAASERSKLSTTLAAVMNDGSVVDAWARGDRAALQARTTDVYAAFKQQGITNWSFTGADGTTFFRLSDPKYFGEKVDRPTVVRCLGQRASQDGFAVGSQGFALRVSEPVFAGERFLGCVEMGSEINRFVGSLKEQTGNEYALFLAKEGIDHEKWARGRALLGLPDNFAEQPTVVIAANTSANSRILEFKQPLASLGESGRVLDVLEEGGRSLSHGGFSIADASGKRAAAIFVVTDISELAESMRQSQRITVGVVTGLIALCSVILIALFQRLIFRRLAEIARVATRVVGGDFVTPIPITAQDEVGRFEELFEQFRQVFLSVLSEAQAHADAAPPPPPSDETRGKAA